MACPYGVIPQHIKIRVIRYLPGWGEKYLSEKFTMFYKVLVVVFVLVAYTAQAQKKDTGLTRQLNDSSLQKGIQKTLQLQAQMDSNFKANLQALQDKQNVQDSINMIRNMDAFMAEKREQDKKMVRALWVKGGIFAVMLAGTIVGFTRQKRAKKKAAVNGQ